MTTKETQLVAPKDKKPNTQIPVIFQNVKSYENEEEDSRFLKIKVWLMHTGVNYNNSSFSRKVVDAHIKTLANTPILAFIEENEDGEQDFSDHRMVLHRTTDGGIDLKYLGAAVGVIPEDNNAKWETRVTDSGESLEYLTVEALMWTKWDEPINIMKNKGFTGQSMELNDNYSGSWDESGVFHFESFSFFGACLLGEGVFPAMRNSTAEIEFSKDENIQNTIEDKLQEFYTLFSQEQGGNKDMTKKTPATKSTSERTVLDTFTSEEYAEAIAMNLAFDSDASTSSEDTKVDPALDNSESTVIEPEAKFEEEPEEDLDPEVDPDPEPEEEEEDEVTPPVTTDDDNSATTTAKPKKKPEEEFALTASQLANQLRIQIGKEQHTDRWGDTCRTYWYVDHTDSTVIFENYQDGYQLYEATYTLNGDNVEIQLDKSYKVKVEYVPFEGESASFTANLERFNVLESQSEVAVKESHKELNENFTALTTDYESLKGQLSELQSYKRTREEEDVRNKFTGKLSEEEFSQVFIEMKDSPLEDIEKELFALIGQKNFSIQVPVNPNVNKLNIEITKSDNNLANPYDALKEYLVDK